MKAISYSVWAPVVANDIAMVCDQTCPLLLRLEVFTLLLDLGYFYPISMWER